MPKTLTTNDWSVDAADQLATELFDIQSFELMDDPYSRGGNRSAYNGTKVRMSFLNGKERLSVEAQVPVKGNNAQIIQTLEPTLKKMDKTDAKIIRTFYASELECLALSEAPKRGKVSFKLNDKEDRIQFSIIVNSSTGYTFHLKGAIRGVSAHDLLRDYHLGCDATISEEAFANLRKSLFGNMIGESK